METLMEQLPRCALDAKVLAQFTALQATIENFEFEEALPPLERLQSLLFPRETTTSSIE